MGGIGIYFDLTQASQIPLGPLGISILGWGFILFGIAAISVIAQLWHHIISTEKTYCHALGFGGLELQALSSTMKFSVVLKLLNILDVPIEYKIDLSKSYIEMNGVCKSSPELGWRGNIIYKQTPQTFILPGAIEISRSNQKGKLHYEIAYGRPGKFMFHQIRDMTLELTPIAGNNMFLQWDMLVQEDKPIARSVRLAATKPTTA